MVGAALHAFIDEYGNTSIETEKEGVSDLFIVTAVLVAKPDLQQARNEAEIIRRKFRQTGELKSSKLKKPGRRLQVLDALSDLPIHTAQFAVDKRRLSKESGFSFKQSFFKNINKRLYAVLTRGFENLSVLADEHGSADFMDGFKRYMERELTLFPQKSMDFVNSSSEVLIQVADVFAGSLAHVLEGRYDEDTRQAILQRINSKSLWLAVWPPLRRPPGTTSSWDTTDEHDELVRDYCLRQAERYLMRHSGGGYPEHVAVLEHLVYRVQFVDNSYVVTGKIRKHLARAWESHPSEQKIREIVRNLRDDGVLIASGNDGYKIPTSVRDLHTFVAHANLIVPPMLRRLAAARNAMILASRGSLDILRRDDFDEIMKLVDALGDLLLAEGSIDDGF